MKSLKIYKNKIVLVDDEDFDFLSQYKWWPDKNGYPKTHVYINNKRTMRPMHRIIMNAQKGQIIDHFNGDILDNRKENFRITNPAGNARNRNSYVNKYKGVVKRQGSKGESWRATICFNHKQICIGYYRTEDAAAVAYNLAAIKYHGEFASLNKVDMNINPDHFSCKNFPNKQATQRKVINIITNQIFSSIKEAAEFYKINYCYLRIILCKGNSNKYQLEYYYGQ